MLNAMFVSLSATRRSWHWLQTKFLTGERILCDCGVSRFGIQSATATEPGRNDAGATEVGVLCAGECVPSGGVVGGGVVRLLSLLHSGGAWFQALHCSRYVALACSVLFIIPLPQSWFALLLLPMHAYIANPYRGPSQRMGGTKKIQNLLRWIAISYASESWLLGWDQF